MLNKDPAMIWIWLNPKNGFINFSINKSMQQDIDEWNDDKTLKPKILFCGRFSIVLNFIYVIIENSKVSNKILLFIFVNVEFQLFLLIIQFKKIFQEKCSYSIVKFILII